MCAVEPSASIFNDRQSWSRRGRDGPSLCLLLTKLVCTLYSYLKNEGDPRFSFSTLCAYSEYQPSPHLAIFVPLLCYSLTPTLLDTESLSADGCASPPPVSAWSVLSLRGVHSSLFKLYSSKPNRSLVISVSYELSVLPLVVSCPGIPSLLHFYYDLYKQGRFLATWQYLIQNRRP